MLKDCLEIFEEILAKEGENFIIDSHIPANGTYIIVDTSGSDFKIKESFEIKLDKKTEEVEGENNIYFNQVRKYDYYSKLIDMNKPIDTKKIIHSNNYLSFYVKKESIGNKKLTDEIIDNYYEILKEPIKKYSSKPKARLSYEKLEEQIGPVDDIFLDKIKDWIKANIFNLDIDQNAKDYLKIFFEAPLELYLKESNRYLIPNIYNSNDYNEIIGGKIYGLPNDNMGLNSKKPYLENKTKKIKVPYLIDNEEALLQKKFFDYLMSCATLKYSNIYINVNRDNEVSLKNNINRTKNGETLKDDDFKGIYLRIQKGKVLEILDYDFISSYRHNLKMPFKYNMYIDLDINMLKNTTIPFYTTYNTKSQIQDILNEVYFSKFLKGNYFTDSSDIRLTDEIVKRNLLISRNAIFNWIYKGHINNIEEILNRVSLQLVKGSILKGNLVKAINQFNLRWSFIEYFKGEGEMADFLNEIRKDLKEKINSKNSKSDSLNKIESDIEYYFAIGQEVYYLLSLSKSGNKNQSLANPFINAKNDDVLKEKLRNLYKKYNYSIEYNNTKASKLYSLILGYSPEGDVNQDMIIAGFLSKSLIYEKKEERDN